MKGAPVAISDCNRNCELVQFSSVQQKVTITSVSIRFLISLHVLPHRPYCVSFHVSYCEEKKKNEMYEVWPVRLELKCR